MEEAGSARLEIPVKLPATLLVLCLQQLIGDIEVDLLLLVIVKLALRRAKGRPWLHHPEPSIHSHSRHLPRP